ncbi:hypothetical protein AUR04nite_20030 [Glutamicibacter uratoxydans]|uniref:DUF222 domain-containing protein n=1 Tax=Glutamicibacter uratoxydans TaxID=43667 RepID=A0A4Y4DVN9_GLUUR|nr:HNH endonuclease signature motif containing protein [Glutamicibacter uratoxydans]GED06471.1 hypothetical protein AUR04nite_20030 [Glutamicibacter uratoxydans]
MSNTINQCAAQLRQQLAAQPALDPATALDLAELASQLLELAPPPDPAGQLADPRFALAYTQQVEHAAGSVARAQIRAAHLLQASAAQALDKEELDLVRRPAELDWSTPARRCTGRTTFKSPQDLLAAWLNINYFDARDRVNAASQLIAQFDYQHQQHPPKFARMAQRFADRTQRPAEIISAARRLQSLEPPADEFTPVASATAQDAAGELVEELVDRALDEPNADTRRSEVNAIFKRVREESREEDPESHTGLYDRGSKSGLKRYELLLDSLDAEYFASLLAQADNPRTEAGGAARQNRANVVFGAFGQQEPADEHPDFITDDEAAARWEDADEAAPSIAQRRLNALMSFLRINSQRLRTLLKTQRTGQAPAAEADDLLVSTVAPQVVVTLTLAELEERAASYGITEHGHRLTPTQLRQVLARGKIIPIVLGGKGEVLDVGRSQRYHTDPMRLAIRIRDGGCIVPGCTMDPESCSVHHIWFWSQGGITSVYWGAMLCETHHHDVHAGLIKVIADGGVPKVILPRFMDPSGTPVRNTINQRRAA